MTKPLTEAEETLFLEKLWSLLARQTELYTMGDSTSVPIETARELLASICYTLQFEMTLSGVPIRDLLERSFYDVLKDGQAHLLDKVQEMKRLWDDAYAMAQRQGKREIMQDLAWIKPFFSEYDAYFFAHRTPWDMGLPFTEAKENLQDGILSVDQYLKRLIQSDLVKK